MMNIKDWFRITEKEIPDSPALVVFTDRVESNITEAIRMVGDIKRLRPHIKTCKSAGAVSRLLAAGITKFKCATIAEAELLGRLEAPDILLAYQPTGPKLQRFTQLIQRYPKSQFSCLVDNIETAGEQSAAFVHSHIIVPVLIDLNVGMNRTGIEPGEGAIALYQYLAKAPGIKVAGLHAYDGHIRGIDMNVRTGACNAAFAPVQAMVGDLKKLDLDVPVVIVGGSPTFPIHAQRKDVECSPGTFVYWDKGYADGCPEQKFTPAAILVTRVISIISETSFTTDLGHKSVAAENEITRRVSLVGHEDLEITGQSEEHLVAKSKSAHGFKVGDVLYGIPFHVCPTVALYERAYTISNGSVTGEWRNEARDRKLENGI